MPSERKKRIRKIVEAVQSILGDDVQKKKLKKAKAMASFIEKMQTRRAELAQELAVGDALPEARRIELERNVATLDKQIHKASKLLEDLDPDD